jgi:phosphate transport system substrate-binding protein
MLSLMRDYRIRRSRAGRTMNKDSAAEDHEKTGKRLPSKTIIAALVLIPLAFSASGCILQRTGVVRVAGSTTVLPLAQEAANRFMDMGGGRNILVQGGGSSVGIAQLQQGIIDIGTSSRELKPEEDNGNIVDHKIALDVIALIVNPRVQVANLSKQQVMDIFTGAVRNWSEVGGEDETIIPVVRDQASGTRQMFDELALNKQTSSSSAIECNSNGIMRETVASTPGSVGYISLGYVDATVKSIDYGGVTPSEQTARDNSYPLSRYLHMFTTDNPRQTAEEFIEYVLSADFQQEVVAREYIPVAQE